MFGWLVFFIIAHLGPSLSLLAPCYPSWLLIIPLGSHKRILGPLGPLLPLRPLTVPPNPLRCHSWLITAPISNSAALLEPHHPY